MDTKGQWIKTLILIFVPFVPFVPFVVTGVGVTEDG
jgi:hypothetical protein